MSAAIADIQIEPGYGNYVRKAVIHDKCSERLF